MSEKSLPFTGSQKIVDYHIHVPNRKQLPLHAKRRLEYGLRTGFSVAICLILLNFFPWTPIGIFLSPVISIISTVRYFGLWQENAFKVVYSSFFGASLGVIVGLSYKTPGLQILLLFFSITWANQCSIWDNLSKVIASLCIILGALWPTLTDGDISGAISFASILALVNVPFFITGLTLLFPYPAVSLYKATARVLVTTKKFSLMTWKMITAFNRPELTDLCCAEFDELVSETHDDVRELKLLARYAESERIIFPGFSCLPEVLNKYCVIAEKLFLELKGLKYMTQRICSNKTQVEFANHLYESLEDVGEEVELALSLVGEQFESYTSCPSAPKGSDCFGWVFYPFSLVLTKLAELENVSAKKTMRSFYKISDSRKLMEGRLKRLQERESTPRRKVKSGLSVKFLEKLRKNKANGQETRQFTFPTSYAMSSNVCTFCDIEDILEESDDSEEELTGLEAFERCVRRLFQCRTDLLYTYNEGRRLFVWVHDDPSSEGKQSPMETMESEETEKLDDLEQALTELEASELISDDGLDRERSQTRDEFYNKNDQTILLKELELEKRQLSHIQMSIKNENIRLSLRNLSPRSAYLHRLCVVVELVASMHELFDRKSESWSVWDFLKLHSFSLISYIIDNVMDIITGIKGIFEAFKVSSFFSMAEEGKKTVWTWVKKNIQALKISAAITISASLLVFNLAPGLYKQGLWTTIVIALIRQETSASSFLVGYQRLEGTVIGTIFSFFVIRIFHCDSEDSCEPYIIFPFIVLWVSFCAMFRDGPRHGYAANVAGIQSVVLLVGSDLTQDGLMTAWGRIEETFIGIALYLAIDNLILPKRTYSDIKASVLRSIDYTRMMFSDSVKAMETLISLQDVQTQFHQLKEDEEKKGECTELLLNEVMIQRRIRNLFETVSDDLDKAEVKIHALQKDCLKQQALLLVVPNEPELWYRRFPVKTYTDLLACFQRVYRSAFSLNSGCRALSVVFCQMVRQEEPLHRHLSHFNFVSKHLFMVSSKTQKALSLAHDALSKLYDRTDYNADLSAIVTLQRTCATLMDAVDQHFRHVYMRQPAGELAALNPFFLVAWQNVFEAVTSVIQDLSDLGMALHAVRNIEALLTI